MIGFKEKYFNYSKCYNGLEGKVDSPSGLEIVNCQFKSNYYFDFSDKGFFRGDLFYHELVRSKVPENFEFSYPVLVPDSSLCYNSAILLFHGLNEKNWDKYFVWADYLVEKTNRPVILFPLAYHMNRVPKSWSDPRMMSDIVSARKRNNNSQNTTFANAALSTRLQFHPELFIYSGLQSCFDVIQLMDEIGKGSNQLFDKNTHFDIFSYSIGSFFSQILMLANPGRRFDLSKLFIFCGGPTFDRMMGDSKYIMDSIAFKSLQELKHRYKLKQIRRKVLATGNETLLNTWLGLEMMMYNRKNRKSRELMFDRLNERVYAVALEKDLVMPVNDIIHTLKGKNHKVEVSVEVIDFPYHYTHELPFPIGDDNIQNLVDRSFTVVFDKAVDFFNETNIIKKR